MFHRRGDERHELTFVPADPGRDSWFAAWTPGQTGGLLDEALDGLPCCDVELYVAADRGAERRVVSARRVDLDVAIPVLLGLPAGADVQPSTEAWAAVVRAALGLLARGRALPWVSPEGWDTWRVDPLDSGDLDHVAALANSMPFAGHGVPSAAGPDRVVEPAYLIRSCFDAVADRMIRSSAAARVNAVDPFAAVAKTRVRHLRSWTDATAAPHCLSTSLVIRVHPPDTDDDEWRAALQVRSKRDASLVVGASELWGPADASTALLGERAEVELLVGLQRAASVCSALEPLLDNAFPSEIELDDEGLDLLLSSAEALASEGIDVRWPSDVLSPTVERRLVVTAAAPPGELPSFTGLASLLEVDWEFLLDGTALSRSELDALAAAKRAVLPLRGRWVRVTGRDRARLAEPAPALTAGQILAAALTGSVEVGEVLPETIALRVEGVAAEVVARVTSFETEREEVAPQTVRAELRAYQRRGLAWLTDLAAAGLGGCLADDMGLGKTLQVLALHAVRGGPTLVVCPTGLLANWEREAARFVPDARVLRYHGSSRSLPELRSGDLVLTTYGVVRSDAEELSKVVWDVVAADEAQNIKNPRSRTARAVGQLDGRSRIALTGTPVENRLTELWSIMNWAVPGLLGPLEEFRHGIAIPIERSADPVALQRLSRLLGPFLLRRRKTDPGIAPDLPPKTERDVTVTMTAEQVSLYKATTLEVLDEIAAEEGISRRGLVLKLLTSLKQIANHPAHYLGEAGPTPGRSGKLSVTDELLDAAMQSGESTLIFTQYVAMGELLVSHGAARGLDVAMLHGGLSVTARQDLVDRFQRRELPILVLSLKAGGTGLNLTAATQVIHYDRWWNPAVEDQATDRAYRIGQDAPVTVHRLVAAGTVEDRVAQLLEAKRDLADRVVSGGDGWIGELSDEELAELVLFEEADAEGEVA